MAPGGAPTDDAKLAATRSLSSNDTTTLSTIAVRAGVNASIVVALLKSADYIQLRVDEMRPKLLAIGNSSEETADLLRIHDDLMNRLREKDDQVNALLVKTDGLGAEKSNPKDALVYDEMAKSLRETWRSLNRQLILRGYLLRETLHFYQMAHSHEQLTQKTIEIVGKIGAQNSKQIQESVEKLINDIIDTTAAVVDLGSSVISQIRTLGQFDDNPERPQEILESCVLIENVMLRVAADWERSENVWQDQKSGPQTVTSENELVVIEQWLEYAEKRVKALNESGQKNVLNEGNKHIARLREIAQSPSSDGGRISHLSGRIEEFLHYLKTRMNRSQRIQAFIQAAKSMMSQLSMMVADMRNANAAMAGELAPLAKQKAVPLISEGKDISAKEVLSYEEQRLVRHYCEDLEAKLREIEELAKIRKSAGKVADQFTNIRSWLDGQVMAFLAQKGDMGGNLNDARDFVAAHRNFSTAVLNRDAEVMALLANKPNMSPDEEVQLSEFVKTYEKVKDILENRIQIGTTYEQVHKFGKDLEGSFDALQVLLENNQEYTNEKVVQQIANVFQMIQDTLSQEKHQADKFISNATQIGKSDEWLNINRAQEAVLNMITDHENRFKYVHLKWNDWQRDKNQKTKVERVMEEIQMWQTDVLEFIGKVDNSTVTSKEEVEQIKQRIEGFEKAGEQHTFALEQLKSQTESEEQISRINVIIDKQEYIKNRLEQLKQKLELTSLLKIVEDVQIWQEEMVEIIRNLNQVVSTQSTNNEKYEQIRRKVGDLKMEIEKKSDHLKECRSLSDNQEFQSQLSKTIENQEQIRRTTLELEEKIELTKLVKIVQDIQLWQEEAIEIIRMLDRSEPKNIQEANELIDRVHDLQETVEHKSVKIHQMKKMSQIPEFIQKVEEIEHVQEQIKNLTVELEEKLEQQKLVKVTEEIQMWQEEMIEIIKMFDSTPMKTVQESEELKEKVKMVKEAIETQQPKIDDVVRKAINEPVRTQIAKVVEQQKHIREMANNLERKATMINVELSRPQQVVEEKKTIELTSLEKTEITLTPEEKRELEILKKIVEEIQMWQEETIEIIRLVERSPPKTLQESDNLVRRVTEISNTVEAQSRRIEDAARFTKDESYSTTVQLTKEKQEQLKQLVRELHEKATSQNIILKRQEEIRERVRAPHILTPLKDSEVEEGARFEFAARIEAEPEPVITWLKDGIDVKSNIDYRQEFVNGIATLVIEESFIEDTARYTVKAANSGGTSESSANLMVKSRSAMSSTIMDEDKPRFVRQMSNVQVSEGETAKLDCIVVGKPEPEITWFKEETAVKESERVHLKFTGDHCQMVIEKCVPLDSGTYTVRAKNVHGEVANFCQMRVVPKKPAPPQTPPKPRMQRPPAIQPPLTNTTWQEGETATLQVFTHGEPRPRVTWKFNDQPLKTSSQITITEQEDGWSKLTINQISPVNAGMYTAVAENETGEAVTGATVHVQPTMNRVATVEHHLQEDLTETIGQPIQKVTTTKKHEEYQIIDFPQPKEPERIVDDKRWVEVIEKHFEEHLSQKSLSPIPQINERRRIEQEQRWVDTIDEIWSPEREIEVKETKTVSGADHYSTHNIYTSSQKPMTFHTTTTSTNISHIGQSHDAVQPNIGRSTTSNESVKPMNIATIRQSPPRELHEARTTPGPASEHVAAIRKTPIRETHQTSITKAPSLENVAKIRQSPVPESHRSTITRRSPSVENVAKIRQSPAPETHRSTITRKSPSVENIAKYQPASHPETHVATTVSGQSLANIAQIHTSSQPDKHGILKEAPKIDRIDDILATPYDEKTIKTVTQTITTTGDIDKQYQKQERKMQQTSTVTNTQSGEGWVQHKHEDFMEPHKSSIIVKKLDIEDSEHINQQTIKTPEQRRVEVKKVEEHRQESKIPIRQQPKSTTTVTETTSGEGWVQQIHQDLQNPHLSSVTVKRLDIEEEENLRKMEQYQQQQHQRQQQIEKRRIEEEDKETRIRNESKIPKIPKEPKTTTTVTETVSGEGWIQHENTDMARPDASTVVVKRLDIEAGENKQVSQVQSNLQKEEEIIRKQKLESRIPLRREPKTNTTVTETTTGEGWIQNVHTNMAHPHASTVSLKRLGIEEEMAKRYGRPISMEMRKQTDDESSTKQRDSFVMASDVEGFWTDGAYTASPTPPPVPLHRSTAEDNMQRIGLMRSTTEPEFLKPFEREYTVEEGGRIVIECILVGNPKPTTRFFFNNRQIIEKSEFLKVCHVNDTYSIIISPVKQEHSGHYKLIAENKRGMAESLTVLHVRPRYQQQNAGPTEHTTVEEEFAMFEYEQRRPTKHDTPKMITPPPAKRIQSEYRKDEEHLETYDMEGKKTAGHPPHFTQTLASTVVAHGDSTTFEGIVTGWPAPTVEWTVDGKSIEFQDVKMSNIGGRVSITFPQCDLIHSGKYMCTAKNSSGVATSSAQLVVRPKTIAPDFIQRLISEEIEEGTQLKWTVRVTGDPMPEVTWLRDGYQIPNCDEVRIVNHGDGLHSLIIVKVEGADSGQFTCLAENIAGEARSTADLVVRPAGTQPGNYFHVTKVTQEKQTKGSEPTTSSAFAIETPRQSEML